MTEASVNPPCKISSSFVHALLSEDSAEVVSKSKVVIDGLKKLYSQKLKPLEKKYNFDEYHSPLLSDSDFDAKPQVLMIGQYSVGKTSFIEYLLGRKFPGQRVGPEPTTDRFIAVMHGDEDRTIPGNAVAVSPDLPYSGLSMFGTAFLNKFEASQSPSKVLENITVIDTPGILSGEKQRLQRGYDFVQVTRWFAERSDLILLLFDAHKLDISDEFQRVIEVLKGHDDKIRCVLNKADQIDRQKLMRVYGALMWSMGKVLKTPEVLRVFIGSFWDQPMLYNENAELFFAEESDLLTELRNLPQNAAIRKINEFVKRARLAKVHCYIIGYLKDKMPAMIGKDRKQKELLDSLPEQFRDIQRKYHLPPGDFPLLSDFQKALSGQKFHKFANLSVKAISELDDLLSKDIPKLMASLPRNGERKDEAKSCIASTNPFAELDKVWEVEKEKARYDVVYDTLKKDEITGKIPGSVCMAPLRETQCSQETLKRVWDLADLDRDGALDRNEFAIAMYLCEMANTGEMIPDELPPSMIPPRYSVVEAGKVEDVNA